MNEGARKLSQAYRREAIAAMTPRERLILKFDLALKAANNGDINRLRQMLILLRKSLDFGADPLIALNALRIYRHCEAVLDEREDFAEVAQIMFHLKRAFSLAQEVSYEPEALAWRERVNKAKRAGALFFGKHGVHYCAKAKGSVPGISERAAMRELPRK